jgi:glycosyltransferase involved in cell wall biosynthesis
VLTSGRGPLVADLEMHHVLTIPLRHLVTPISPVRDVVSLLQIRSVLKHLRPDLLAVHMSKASVLGRIAGRLLGIPVVFTAHGWSFTPGIRPLEAAVYRRIEQFVGPLARKIITVSEFDRRLALQARVAHASRLVTVHNGIPDIASDLHADPARSPPRLIMVARFDPQKDHTTLLRALAGLKEHAWELDLVGDGELRREAESLVTMSGIGNRVRFWGERLDVHELLAQAQIALLVTNYEGFPLSILEAMRAGLPLVASSVAGITESVHDGVTGYLIPRGDSELLRDRIRRLVTTPSLRVQMGSAGRMRYERQFTLDRMVAKTLEVYREIRGSSSSDHTRNALL